MSNAKKPADHKVKKSAADALRTEAQALPDLEQMLGREVSLDTRDGVVTVSILPDPFDWDAEIDSLLLRRPPDYFNAFLGMLSTEDGARLKEARPTVRGLLDALAGLNDEVESSEPSPGESQAS